MAKIISRFSKTEIHTRCEFQVSRLILLNYKTKINFVKNECAII